MIFSLIFCVYFFNHLFLHNVCVMIQNLSDTILYLVTFTYKLAKQNGCQNVKKPPYVIWFIAHKSTISVFERLLLLFFSGILERRNLYLIFKYKMSVVFYIFTVMPLNMLMILGFNCSNLVDQK